jgi:hypothetical protein
MAATATSHAAHTALLVLGMHRSGTSALAGALARLGVELGPRLIEAAPDNPLGYWEHAGVVEIHDRLLHALGSSWEDPRELPAGWIEHPAALEAARELEALLAADFARSPLWAVKDPRLCRFLPLWLPLLARMGIQAKALAIVREPGQVARSLAKRDGIGAAHAELLWLRAASEIAEGTQGLPRALLDYEALLADPGAALSTAATQLQLSWPNAGESLRAAVSESLRNHGADADADARASTAGAIHSRLDGADAWQRLAEAGKAVAHDLAPARTWFDSLVPAIARARRQQAESLARLAQTDAGLARADELSHERMTQLEAMDGQLSQTQAALDEAEALSVQRLESAAGLDAQLARTQRALADAEALADRHLQSLKNADAQLARTQDALAKAETLTAQRMQELAAIAAQLARTEGAQAQAQAQCQAQLAELSVLAAQLAQTEAALAQAQSLSVERLEQMQALDRRLGEMDAALAHAQQLVAERTAERDVAQARRR